MASEPQKLQTAGMVLPVECLFCGQVYDVMGLNPTVKGPGDCAEWTTPCCSRPGVRCHPRPGEQPSADSTYPAYRKVFPDA